MISVHSRAASCQAACGPCSMTCSTRAQAGKTMTLAQLRSGATSPLQGWSTSVARPLPPALILLSCIRYLHVLHVCTTWRAPHCGMATMRPRQASEAGPSLARPENSRLISALADSWPNKYGVGPKIVRAQEPLLFKCALARSHFAGTTAFD